eukprot:1737492-Ditylum_brightwellii.AAC.1
MTPNPTLSSAPAPVTTSAPMPATSLGYVWDLYQLHHQYSFQHLPPITTSVPLPSHFCTLANMMTAIMLGAVIKKEE